ncbi:MAG: RNA polymerase sigma factor [Sphingobacteriales bacterium]|nr:RNA polymerase sigma factor [Sphingobacteriales bacterium]
MTPHQYNECVELYADKLFRFALKTLRNEADADDVVQITFEKVWLTHESVIFEQAKNYFFKVAYHAMMDMFRRKRPLVPLDQIPETAQLSEAEPLHHLQDLLEKSLQQLPPLYQSLVLLRDYEGYSYEEIAQIAQLSDSQVKVYLFRARRHLKQHIVASEQIRHS